MSDIYWSHVCLSSLKSNNKKTNTTIKTTAIQDRENVIKYDKNNETLIVTLDEKDVDEFDEKFEFKEKIVHENQL